MQVLMQLLKQREEQHIDLNTKRLDRLWFVASMHSTKTCFHFSVTITTFTAVIFCLSLFVGLSSQQDLSKLWMNFREIFGMSMTWDKK